MLSVFRQIAAGILIVVGFEMFVSFGSWVTVVGAIMISILAVLLLWPKDE